MMKNKELIVNKVRTQENGESVEKTSTCIANSIIKDRTLYIYLYQNAEMGNLGWLNLNLKNPVEEVLSLFAPDKRLLKCLEKTKFDKFIVATYIDGVLPYEVYEENQYENVKDRFCSKNDLINSYPSFSGLV